jgi:hypothetical protein
MKLYVVKSKDGKYFRAKGFGGSGNSWVDTLEKARIYAKIGPAKSVVTWWFNNYPQHGPASIVELETLVVKEIKVDTKEIEKRKLKTQIRRAQNEINWLTRYNRPETNENNERMGKQKALDNLKQKLNNLK